jgi:hypothetical protein
MDQRRDRNAVVLRNAAQLLGGTARLARFLGVRDDQVERWMAGAEAAPLWVVVQTLELVADTRHAVQAPTVPGSPADQGAKRSR